MHVIPEWLFDHPVNGIRRKSCRPSKVAALDLDYQLLHSWIYRGLQLCMPYKNVDACNPAPQEDVCKPIKFLQNNLLVNINRKSGYIICQQWSFAKDVRIFWYMHLRRLQKCYLAIIIRRTNKDHLRNMGEINIHKNAPLLV